MFILNKKKEKEKFQTANDYAVGESRRVETAVEILNLVPGTIFHICVFSVSAANFQTPSAILHVRTRSLPLSEATQRDNTASVGGGPAIRALIPRSPGGGLASPSAPLMSREHSGNQLQAKRTSGARKPSPSANGADTGSNAVDAQKSASMTTTAATTTATMATTTATATAGAAAADDEGDENQQKLVNRLKALKHESEALDKQATEEEEEHIALLKELERQRDIVKRRVKEKDEASGDLKKQVYKLENVNRTVQSDRSKRERLLQQKEAEKNKRRNDIVRWEEQVSRTNRNVEQAKAEMARVLDEARKRKSQIREKIAAEHAEMKSIDDEIQDKGGRIKKLEEERKKLQGGGDNEDGYNELDRIDNERARQWEMKLANLQARYVSLVGLHAQAQRQYQDTQGQVKSLISRVSSSTFPLPQQDLDLLSNTAATVRPRHRGSFASNLSSPVNFPGVDNASPFQGAAAPISTASPTFASKSAFFNVKNGMVMPDVATEAVPSVSSNPQMSPHVGAALLPSDLLGDEEPPEMPGPISRVSSGNALESFPPMPASPGESVTSQPASLLASPRESKSLSLRNDSPPSVVETAAAAATTEDATAPKSTSRKLVNLFGFSRPRGKTLADEPPLLGTLKPGQSHSLPRTVDEIEPIGSKRRSSFTGDWATLLPKTSDATTTANNNDIVNVDGSSSDQQLQSRRAALYSIFSSSGRGGKPIENPESNAGYNQFSPRHDPIDPSYILGTVRRDSLSHSPTAMASENQLPHPSTDNHRFGWPSVDRTGGHRSPLGFDWSSHPAWSNAPSPRRPSVSYGSSTGHLPLGSLTGEPDFVQNLLDIKPAPARPLQAPIGTRPSSSHQVVIPRLNPAAPSFKTVSDNDNDDDDSGDGDLESDPLTDDDGKSPKEFADSLDDGGGDSDSVPLELTASENSTEQNVTSKESLIRKWTRRGSSGKFGSWKERPGLFFKKGGERP